MQTIEFEIISLSREKIKKVNKSHIILGDTMFKQVVDYVSSLQEESDDDVIEGEWSEDVRHYREGTIKKDKIDYMELKTSLPDDDGERSWMLTVCSNSAVITTFFNIEDQEKAEDMKSQISKWLGWN